jgi:hypothetical protein
MPCPLVDEGWLRVEAVSNAFLDAQHELTGEQEGALVDLGFGVPEEAQSPNFWVDLEQREADRAAWLIAQALREVYGVVHPGYLEADGLEPGVSRLSSLALQPPGWPGSLAPQPPAEDAFGSRSRAMSCWLHCIPSSARGSGGRRSSTRTATSR